jgi:hypothetical protein
MWRSCFTMPVTFTSFPRVHRQDGPIHAVELDDDDDYDMELEDAGENLGAGSRLTCPGETLTSTQAFMR